MCSAAVLLCVCVCRIRVRVRTCHTTSPSSRVPAVQIPSIICVCIISHVSSLDYASPATAVRPVTSVRVFQHVTSYTCVQRNPCAHCHHTMRPSSPNSAVVVGVVAVVLPGVRVCRSPHHGCAIQRPACVQVRGYFFYPRAEQTGLSGEKYDF